MTTEQHLNAIVAKCKCLLELAERRTQGEWKADGAAGCDNVRDLNGTELLFTSGMHITEDSDPDAAFIAACAGSAEAGWRATIAACATAKLILAFGGDAESGLVKSILAAWPEELL